MKKNQMQDMRLTADYPQKNMVRGASLLLTIISLLMAAGLIVYLFIQGGTLGAGLLWAFLFPFIAHHLQDYKTGSRINAILIALLFVLFLLARLGLPVPQHFAPPYMLVYFTVLVCVSVFLHIREKNQSSIQHALKQSRDKYEALFNSLNLGVAMISPEMKILEANQTLKKWYPEVFFDSHPYCFACLSDPPRESPCENCGTSLTFKSGQLSHYKKRKSTILGERDFMITLSPMVNNKNEVYAVIETLEDITEEEKAKNRLKQQNLFNQLLAALSAELINAKAENFNIRINYLLERTGRFFGAERSFVFIYSDDLSHLSITHEWAAEGVRPLKESIKALSADYLGWWYSRMLANEVVKFSSAHHIPETALMEKEFFSLHQIHSMISIPITSGQHPIGVFGFNFDNNTLEGFDNDISLLRVLANAMGEALLKIRSEEALINARDLAEAANKAKSQFLANMSHEIRTPLNGVIGFTDLLRDTPLDDTQKLYVENAHQSAQGLLGIISDILDFSKIEAGKLDLDPVFTDIKQLCTQTTDVFSYQARDKALRIVLSFPDSLPSHAMVDPIRLRQVLVNLLSNAVKFTEQGEIRFSVTYQAASDTTGIFRFEVSDTGIGIPDEQQHRLFEAFMQADVSTTRKYGGTGLGLPISNQILEKMGSCIEFESRYGQGSRFWFTLNLPMNDLKANEETGDNNRENQLSGSGAGDKPSALNFSVILIVEDVEMNMRLIKTLLQKYCPEARLLQAYDGNQAIALFKQYEPDLILMDIQMPGIDGMEASRQIRQLEKKAGRKKTGIIALTAGAMLTQRDQCLAAGMDAFISKPIKRQKLYEILMQFAQASQPKSSESEFMPASSEHQERIFNLSAVEKRTQLSPSTIEKLARTSAQKLDEYLNSLRHALHHKNIDAVYKQAHTIKGVAMNMEFSHLAELARQFEQLRDYDEMLNKTENIHKAIDELKSLFGLD